MPGAVTRVCRRSGRLLSPLRLSPSGRNRLVPAKASPFAAFVTSTHYLSIGSEVYRDIAHGRQHALCVPKTEGLMIGDQVVIREQRVGASGKLAYTDAWLMRRVTALLEGDGILETHVVCSFNSSTDNERSAVIMRRQIGLAEQQGVSIERFFSGREKRERARREILRRSAERVARVRAERRLAPALEPRRL